MNPQQEAIKILEPVFKEFCTSAKRQKIHSNITQSDKNEICRLYKKNIQDEIIYLRQHHDTGDNRLTIITDKGIYYRCDYYILFIRSDAASCDNFFSWEDIHRVEYSEKKKAFFIYFDESYESYYRIDRFDLLDGYYEASCCMNVAKKLTEVATLFDSINTCIDKFFELEDEEKYYDALTHINNIIEKYGDDKECLPFLLYLKGRAYVNLIDDNLEEAIYKEYCKEAISNLSWSCEHLGDDWKEYEYIVNNLLSYAYYANKEYLKARNHQIIAMGCEVPNLEEAKETLNEIEDNLKEQWDNYIKEDYIDRKYIMPVKDEDIGGCITTGIEVFRMSNIPSCFKFPMGHPVVNQLYIGHPYKPGLYVPFDESEEALFIDKIQEFCYLLGCLGAEEIILTSIKGKNIHDMSSNSNNFSGDANVKLVSGEVNLKSNFQNQKSKSDNSERTMKIKLDPMKKPYVPNGLTWYAEQPQWQRLVKNRLEGNMLTYDECVSSSQTNFSSSTERNEIKASAKYLWVKLNVSVGSNVEKQFKESTETQWKVEVKFRSIKDFEQDNHNDTNTKSDILHLTDKEEAYKEEVLFCIEEDGCISDVDRNYLERKRIKFGVTKERADLIEESCSPSLTDDEKEYIEIYKELVGEGEITDRKRRLLNRERDSLGISEDRAKELEKI